MDTTDVNGDWVQVEYKTNRTIGLGKIKTLKALAERSFVIIGKHEHYTEGGRHYSRIHFAKVR